MSALPQTTIYNVNKNKSLVIPAIVVQIKQLNSCLRYLSSTSHYCGENHSIVSSLILSHSCFNPHSEPACHIKAKNRNLYEFCFVSSFLKQTFFSFFFFYCSAGGIEQKKEISFKLLLGWYKVLLRIEETVIFCHTFLIFSYILFSVFSFLCNLTFLE